MIKSLFKRIKNAIRIWSKVNSMQDQIVPFRKCWKLAPDELIDIIR